MTAPQAHCHRDPVPPTENLAEPWMRGVAANPAAPDNVLLRLLAPAALLDTLLADPVPATAEAAASNPRQPPARLHALLDAAGLPR